MKIAPFILLVSLVPLILFSSGVRAEVDRKDLQRLVDSYAENRGFSGTVLVARRGEILIEASYGRANIEWDIPNIPVARYRIGSLSKPFTATLIMTLVEDGVLSLDGALGEYLPDLYADTPVAPVTIAQLLAHTSGITDIPNNFNDPWYQTTARLSFTPEAFAKEWIKPVLAAEPGSQWRYNNAGFILLGVIIERVTGLSYAENLEARIFTPAGMSASGVFTRAAVIESLAQGYSPTLSGDLEQPLFIDPGVFSSAASIYATARDIYHFDRALYGDKLLPAKARNLMMSVKADGPYGYGWGVETWPLADGRDLSVVSHTGSIPGYQSYYLRSEASEDCVIVLNNKNQGSVVVAMGRDLMQTLNGKPVALAKRSLEDLLVPVAFSEGVQAMIAAYENLGDQRNDYDLNERPLNRLGYKFLRLDRLEEAIAVFEWNTLLHPGSANTHDSLGEAYRAAGRIDDAIRSYETAIALQPEMPSALTALEQMRSDSD